MKTKFLLFSFLIFMYLSGISSDKNVIDSLHKALDRTQSDTGRINTMARLANKFIMVKEIGRADSMIKQGFVFAESKSIKAPYDLHWAKADVHFNKYEIQEGLEEMDIVLNILGDTGPVKEIANARNFKGLLYLYGGKFSKSIETYNENIHFAKKNHIYSATADAYSGLGYIYRNLGDTEEERISLLKMADASIKDDNDKTAASAYFRLGDIGMEKDSNFSYAIEHYQKSLDYRKKLNDTVSIAFLLLRIGWNHYLNEELETALDYFFYSLEYSIPIDRLTSITNAYGNIGTIFRDKKDYKKAIKYYKKSIEYSHKANDWYNLSWLYKDISDMFKSQEDYKKAYDNHVLHKQFSDSLEIQKYNKGLTDARSRYEANKAEKELELVTFKLNQQKYYIYGFAGLIFLTLVIGFLIFRQNRFRTKQRLSEMNHKISEVTQKNLRQQMNPHFIFNTLNSIQYYMYQHDKISTNNYLTKFSLLMRKTLENSQHTSIPIKDELDALELYLELESLRFKKKFDYSINVDDDIDLLILKIPTMLIQPFVENSICHGLVNKETKGNVSIDLKLIDNQIICTIEDNGIGRKAAMELSKNKNHNSLGTKITASRLNLVNSIYGNNMQITYIDQFTSFFSRISCTYNFKFRTVFIHNGLDEGNRIRFIIYNYCSYLHNIQYLIKRPTAVRNLKSGHYRYIDCYFCS